MLRLDHNRALSQIAAKTGKAVADIEKAGVWGNHSPTMYADYRFATIGGASVKDMINDQEWNANTFLPTVGKRGAAIIEARACRPPRLPPMRPSTTCATGPWAPTANGSPWASRPTAGTASPRTRCLAFPVTTANGGEYTVVRACRSTNSAKACINKTLKELQDEQAAWPTAVSAT